jgi:hypothetical protein
VTQETNCFYGIVDDGENGWRDEFKFGESFRCLTNELAAASCPARAPQCSNLNAS